MIKMNLSSKGLLIIKEYGILNSRKGCDDMVAVNTECAIETADTTKLEFYRLIGEGYKAMQEDRTSTIDEVREKLKKRREERG